MIVECVLLLIALRHKIGRLDGWNIIKTVFKLSVAGIFMAIIVQALKAPLAAVVNMNKFWGIAVQGGVAGGVGIIVYSTVAYFLKIGELRQFISSARRKFIRHNSANPEVMSPDGL
jgi:peptidoglycan biosynthesis protein MviN/MurJ (putative lipid II flippase)